MKNFFKALSKDNPSFKFLLYKFSALNDAKIGPGVFDGLQIGELMKDSSFN